MKTSKLIRSLCATFLLVLLNFGLITVTFAGSPTPTATPVGQPVSGENTEVDRETSTLPLPSDGAAIYEAGNLPVPPDNQEGFTTLETFVLGALGYLKPLVAIVGILYLTIAGYQMVVDGSEEGDIENAKKTITYVIIAFFIISMSEDLAKIFDLSQDTLLESPQEILTRVRLFDRQIEILITFIKYIIGAVAMLILVRSAARLITLGDSEDEATKEKQSIGYVVAALLIIYIGDIFIDKVLYRVDKSVYTGITGVHPQLGLKEGIEEITGLTQFALAIIGPLILIVLIYAAFIYATAAGDDEQTEKAKRMIKATVIGMVLVYGAFAIISTVVAGKLEDISAIVPAT